MTAGVGSSLLVFSESSLKPVLTMLRRGLLIALE